MGAELASAADLISRARALVFDFDGTLVDSNTIKRRAFEVCFEDFPDRLEEILGYCWGDHHVPRGDKFKHVYERILGRPYTPEVETALLERFLGATTRAIIGAPEISGAEHFLRMINRTHLTALLSTTPHETLVYIVGERGWRGYFGEIQGAPVNKTAWLSGYRARQGLAAGEIVLFGDTLLDRSAAEEARVTFVGVGVEGDRSITDFAELTGALARADDGIRN